MTRRAFLKFNKNIGLSYIASVSLLGSLTQSEAAPSSAYRALVCIFLEGGNDSFNMLIPNTGIASDPTTPLGAYAEVRGEVAITTGILPLSGTDYGFHPKIGKLQALFNSGELAVISNVGTLVQPLASPYTSFSSIQTPSHLFSHNSQQALWMFGDAKNTTAQGWASKVVERFGWNGTYVNINVDGSSPFQSGGAQSPFEIKGKVAAFNNFSDHVHGGDEEMNVPYKAIFNNNINNNHELVKVYANLQKNSIDVQNEMNSIVGTSLDYLGSGAGDFPVHAHEAGRPLREQLSLVLKMIAEVGATANYTQNQQIYFVRQHGWDSHDNQLSSHADNLEYLSGCLDFFYGKLKTLSLQDKVTTFTASEFGRSLVPNGDGTDHGWGGHALVLGGAVNGGVIYGTVPRVEKDSPDAISGRMVPTIAVEEYSAKLVKWLNPSATSTDLNAIFPNLSAFSGSSFSTASPADSFMKA